MFEFTTQTILNALNIVEVNNNNKSVGKNNVILVKEEGKNPYIRINQVRFSKGQVLDIQKKLATPEHLAKVTFDMSEVAKGDDYAGNYRILIYIGMSNNNTDSFYANDFVYNGKPFYIEFPVKKDEEAASIATKVKKIADKYLLFMSQEAIMNISIEGTKVTFECVNGYQQIKVANIQKYDTKEITCCNWNGEYEDVIVGLPLTWKIENNEYQVSETEVFVDGVKRNLGENEVGIEPGIEAFCDYNWIIHNLRLPTSANTSFWSPTKTEMPAVGATYNQYIVRMCTERDGIAGEAVGQRVHSVTNHVFYVNAALDAGTFETELKKILNNGNDWKTEADNVLEDPFENAPTEN